MHVDLNNYYILYTYNYSYIKLGSKNICSNNWLQFTTNRLRSKLNNNIAVKYFNENEKNKYFKRIDYNDK